MRQVIMLVSDTCESGDDTSTRKGEVSIVSVAFKREIKTGKGSCELKRGGKRKKRKGGNGKGW